MIAITWSSTVQSLPTVDAPAKAAHAAIVGLFAGWQVTRDKGAFMTSLDLYTAQALTDYIVAHTPKPVPTPKQARCLSH